MTNYQEPRNYIGHQEPSDSMPLVEPIEMQIKGREGELKYRLVGTVKQGMVMCSLTSAQGFTPLSLSNLQSTGLCPRKAIRGWQLDLYRYVNAGLYRVGEWA